MTIELPRPPAPRLVAVVRDFVNTWDHETRIDDLSERAGLSRYLHAEGLCAGASRASEEDLLLARQLRAGLRRALELNHDAESEPLPELGAALRRLPICLDWSAQGAELRSTEAGVRGGLARIGIAAQECVADGVWWRLKICAFDDCEWAYYDHSRNRSRNWCEYGCGNKIKTRAYRARQRSATA